MKRTPFFLLILLIGCSSPKEPDSPIINILSEGMLSCVNSKTDVTCFGGRFPDVWDGKSPPSAPIVFHRPGRRAIAVGPAQVCLDNGECFGDAAIGDAAVASVVLKPLKTKEWLEVEIGLNIVCVLDLNGRANCWGEDWGPLQNFPNEWLNQPEGRFDSFSLGEHFCGNIGDDLVCHQLAGKDVSPIVHTGYRDSCASRYTMCASSTVEPNSVSCWFPDKSKIDLFNIQEFACGGLACTNNGDKVKCYSHLNDPLEFKIKLTGLSVGAFHFCGLDEQGHLVCKFFSVPPDFESRRVAELLSLQGWMSMEKARRQREEWRENQERRDQEWLEHQKQ